ncbi:YfkD-like protein [Melghiribacillus thermohalophilus]|uniref:YfkD-like protein n=1 Tax=Melghiribacillus thermohalophilus TaxID=1324956 RepID=A0A4R3MT87_9BACI|nr:YfkD famly protein [Melghiribacillus thermohalophilus]TCT19640.1 YfkD-like protein [Melghiribacillus thermohalophilus]
MNKFYTMFLTIGLCLFVLVPVTVLSEEKAKEDKEKITPKNVPSHVLNISKENTYPNSTKDLTFLEPSSLTKELIDGADVKIENPDLIKMLNETTIHPSPIAFGYRSMIYLGNWPLNYESQETSVNWEYQEINVNELNNYGGDSKKTLNYVQEQEKEINGGLTSKVEQAESIKKLMLLKAQENVDLPLSFKTIIGKGTKKEQTYGVPPKKNGRLLAYAPAVNEKGILTMGEVYIKLKGSNKTLVVKNVEKQGIGAWIPIQDYVSFSFQLKDH